MEFKLAWVICFTNEFNLISKSRDVRTLVWKWIGDTQQSISNRKQPKFHSNTISLTGSAGDWCDVTLYGGYVWMLVLHFGVYCVIGGGIQTTEGPRRSEGHEWRQIIRWGRTVCKRVVVRHSVSRRRHRYLTRVRSDFRNWHHQIQRLWNIQVFPAVAV